MAKPEERERPQSSRLGAVSLGVALVAAASLTVCVMCLDARRRDQVEQLTDQLDTLRQLIDSMQRQLDRHEEKINSTIQIKTTPKSEPAEEVVYEDEYEYDDEEGSYEYDDEDEPNSKATVKRTTVLGDITTRNFSVVQNHGRSRNRRDIRSHDVPVREESVTQQVDNYNGPVSHRAHSHSHSSIYQEQKRPEESVIKLRHEGRNRNMEIELLSENSGEFTQPHIPRERQFQAISAHFIGDASQYNTGVDPHFYGSNILYHPQGHFIDWKPSNWMSELGATSYFPMHNGKINIQKAGVYFVYAQIYYAATQDRCGFHIKHNGKEVAQCMTMTTGRSVKRNTCFTAATVQLHKSDLLWVSEVEGYRNTSFKGSQSFFGLMQLTPT